MDFTYANPSIWLIDSSADIWYRVCGPLVPGGGHAHPSYSSLFSPYLERFAAAAHVAFCLIDFYPGNRKLSLGDIINEVAARTRGRIDKPIILQNFEVICEHVAPLAHPDDWDGHLSFEKSPVIQQLRKKGESLKRGQKLQTLTTSRAFAVGVPKSLFDMSAGGEFDVTESHTALLTGKNSLPGDPLGTERTHKGKPVILDDRQLWSIQTANGNPPPPFPLQQSLQTRALFGDVDRRLIPGILKVWSVLQNFRHLLSIPDLRLEDFVCLLDGRATRDYVWGDLSSAHPMLREIHVALMVPLICERTTTASFSKVHYNPPSSTSRALDSFFDRPEVRTPVTNSITIWDTLGCGQSLLKKEDVSQVLRTADCWVEVSLLLLTEKLDCAALPQYVDPVGDMLVLLEGLLANPSYQLFTHEAGKVLTSTGSNTYSVTCPYDLTCIIDAVRGGFFECGAYSSNDDSTREGGGRSGEKVARKNGTLLTAYGVQLGSGDYVDAYSDSLRAWTLAKVVCILPQAATQTSSHDKEEGCQVQVTFEGWNSSFDETYSSTSIFLAPPRTLSRDLSIKHTHPDSLPHEKSFLIAKTYQDRGRHEQLIDWKYDAAETIAARVRGMLDQAVEYFREFPTTSTSELLAAVDALRTEFDHKYDLIVKTKSQVGEDRAYQLSSELADIASRLYVNEYNHLSIRHKLTFLDWLCNEMLCSNDTKKYLEDAMERRHRAEKEQRQKQVDRRTQEGASEPSGRSFRGKRPLEGTYAESDADDSDEDNNQHKKKAIKLKHADKALVGSVDPESVQSVSDEELLGVEARLEPLGKDRDGSLYWKLSGDEHPHRLFYEKRSVDGDSEWSVFSTYKDLSAIASWLSEFGFHESQLRSKLMCILGKDESVNSSADRLHVGNSSTELPGGNVVAISDVAEVMEEEAVSTPTVSTFAHSRYYGFWIQKELSSHFHLHALSVTLTSRGQMEVGVKDLDGRVIVTAFKENEADGSCCAKEAGVRIGDHIVCINGYAIRDIYSLQMALRSIVVLPADVTSRKTLVVMVLRHPNPVKFCAFKAALSSDSDIKKLMNVKINLSVKSDADIPTHIVAHRSDIPTSLCGIVMQMAYCARSTYATSADWAEKEVSRCAERFARTFRQEGESTSTREETINTLKMCLLRLENALFVSDRVLNPRWKEERFRYKWRSACLRASTFSGLSMAAASLYQVVDWEAVESMSLAMERPKWLQLVPKAARADISGQSVIYYADGEAEAREFMSRHHLPEMPMSQGVDTLLGTGQGVQCKIHSIRYYAGGPVDEPAQCFPYWRLELRVVFHHEKVFCDCPSFSICPENEARQTRIFNRILNVLHSLPESAPFLQPVDRQVAQDYYDVISTPMYLSEMTRKVKGGMYPSLGAFLQDVELILSNCILYCTERYPVLIPMAKTLRDTAACLVDKLSAEFSGYSEQTAQREDTLVETDNCDTDSVFEKASTALITDHPLAGM